MSKVSSFRMFWKSHNFWLYASSMASSVRKLLLFSLFSLAAVAFTANSLWQLFILSGFCAKFFRANYASGKSPPEKFFNQYKRT